MRRRFRDQLVLDLDRGGRQHPPERAPAELVSALADLLLEVLGNQNNQMLAERETCDAFQDHT
jgi:hypothetical protein